MHSALRRWCFHGRHLSDVNHEFRRRIEVRSAKAHVLPVMHVTTGQSLSRAVLHFSITAFDVSLATVEARQLLTLQAKQTSTSPTTTPPSHSVEPFHHRPRLHTTTTTPTTTHSSNLNPTPRSGSRLRQQGWPLLAHPALTERDIIASRPAQNRDSTLRTKEPGIKQPLASIACLATQHQTRGAVLRTPTRQTQTCAGLPISSP